MARPQRRSILHEALSSQPEALKALFRGVEVYAGLTPDDFREMAKFEEATNVEGLPVHPIRRPPSSGVIREFEGALADLPRDLLRELRAALSREPCLLVRGCLAGASLRPFALSAAVPQSAAHLAQGLATTLWPAAGAAPDADNLFLIQIPDFDEQILLHVPRAGIFLALGTDDLRCGLLVALEAANRLWSRVEGEGGRERRPDVRLLPGGSFIVEGPIDVAERGGGAPSPGPTTLSLVFSGESVPVSWEESLVRRIAALGDRSPRDIQLAGGEPWVAQAGGRLCPLWYNPPLPARLLAACGRWLAAALHPAALPFGVRVDELGRVDLAGGPEEAFIIVPRRAVPAPFPNSAAPMKPARLLTHKLAREEALELWALGFPTPELI